MLDRRLDQRLAVGAGDEDAWPDLQVDGPEAGAAGDVGHGFAGEATLDVGGEGVRGALLQKQVHRADAGAERVGHEQLGILARLAWNGGEAALGFG
jgi:hypothetical protein